MTNGPVERVIVYREPEPRCGPECDVTAVVVGDVTVVIEQGRARIAVPLKEFGRFVDNLECIYTGQEPVVASTEGDTL